MKLELADPNNVSDDIERTISPVRIREEFPDVDAESGDVVVDEWGRFYEVR